MRMTRGRRGKFAGMKRLLDAIKRLFHGRRHFLLMDGTHSCVYVPRRTYRKWMRMLYRSLEADPKAENSLRFLWTVCGGRWLLLINPSKNDVHMACTCGLARDSEGRIIIPCPYIQRMLHAFDLPIGYCGRVRIVFEKPYCGAIAQMRLKKSHER